MAVLGADDRHLITAAGRGKLTCGADYYLIRGVRVHSPTTIAAINRLLDAGLLEFTDAESAVTATAAGREALR